VGFLRDGADHGLVVDGGGLDITDAGRHAISTYKRLHLKMPSKNRRYVNIDVDETI
jgi:hypothetical protein